MTSTVAQVLFAHQTYGASVGSLCAVSILIPGTFEHDNLPVRYQILIQSIHDLHVLL